MVSSWLVGRMETAGFAPVSVELRMSPFLLAFFRGFWVGKVVQIILIPDQQKTQLAENIPMDFFSALSTWISLHICVIRFTRILP